MTAARRAALGGALALCLALLPGCGPAGGPDQGAAAAGGPVCSAPGTRPVTLVTGPDVSSTQVRDALFQEWDERCPQHPVRLVELPPSADEQRSQLVAAEQSGTTGYDVLDLDVTWTAEFARDGLIQPLEHESSAGFFPNVWSTVVYAEDGTHPQVWGVPFNTDVGLLYYRTNAVQGTPPTTWDDLARLASLHGKGNSYVTQLAPYEGLTVNALEMIWNAGGQLVGPDGRVVHDPTSERRLHDGLRNLFSLYKQGVILPSSISAHEAESIQDFEQGKVAFMRGWPYMYDVLTESGLRPGTQFSVTSLPGGVSALGGQNLAVARHSAQSRLARQLIAFLTSPASERCLLQGGFAAARESAYATDGSSVCPLSLAPAGGSADSPSAPATTANGLPRYAQTLRKALAKARPRPVTPYYAAFTHQVQVDVTAILHQSSGSDVDTDKLISDVRRVLMGQG